MIRCVGTNILVSKSKEEKKVGALFLATKEKSNYYGTVVSIGEDVKIGIQKFDEVLVSLYAGTIIEENDKEVFLVINQNDIIGVKTNV